MKHIAVIVNSHIDIEHGALSWVIDIFGFHGYKYSRIDRIIKDETRTVIFFTPADESRIQGFQFDAYIKYPFYESFEDLVRKRRK